MQCFGEAALVVYSGRKYVSDNLYLDLERLLRFEEVDNLRSEQGSISIFLQLVGRLSFSDMRHFDEVSDVELS